MKISPKEHRQRHLELHAHLDELLADFIAVTGKRPSQETLMEFVRWSHTQTVMPTSTTVVKK